MARCQIFIFAYDSMLKSCILLRL